MKLRVAVLLTVLVAGSGCSGADDTSSTTSSAGASASSPSGPVTTSGATGSTQELPAVEDVGDVEGETLDVADADWIQVVDGAAWTAVPGAVARLDDTGHETARVPARPGSCLAMDVAYGSLWVGVCHPRHPEVLRIDPGTGRLRAAIALPPGLQFVPEGSLGAGEGGVWAVTSSATGTKVLVKIDPRSERVADRLPLPPTVAGVRAGLGGVWVTDPSNARLLHLDPADGRVVARVPVGVGARFFAVGEGGVWVQNNTDATVTHVDAATDEAVATIPVDESIIEGGDLAVGGGSVWARVGSSLVTRIDPATDAVLARYGAPQGSGSVAAETGWVWITAHDVDAVYRIPLR